MTMPVKQVAGAYAATVYNTADPMNQNRVQLLVPQVLGNAVSQWAVPLSVVTPSPTPAVGQAVIAMFLGGDVSHPVYSPTTQTPSLFASYDAQVAEDNPVAWWKLNDLLGSTTAADSTGNNFGGTANNVTFQSPDAVAGNGSALFDGTNSNVVTGYTAPALTSFTAEIWVDLNGTTPATWANLFGTAGTGIPGAGDEFDGFAIGLNPTGWAPFVNLGNGTTSTTVTMGADLPSTGWTYLAVTWDGTTVTTYQNGATSSQAAWAGPMGAATLPAVIGSSTGNVNWFEGLLAEAAIYDTALPYTRILAHYQAQNQGITGSNIAAGTIVAGIVDGTTIAGAEFIAGVTGGSQFTLLGNAATPFNITNEISGTLGAVASMTTTDTNEELGGVLASAIFGTGTTAKMSTVLSSPFGTEGMAVVLSSQNDAGSDTAWAMIGTVSTPDDTTINFSPVMYIAPYVVLIYDSGSSITVVTRTSGSSISISGSAFATGKGETWGSGGSLSGASGGRSAEGGCGGGEYASDPNFAITPGGTVTYSVSTSGSNANTTMTGASSTITAHPGQPGTTSGYGAGGTGSTAPVHHDGGRGGNPSSAFPGGGGGGGAAGSSAEAGGHGGAGSPSTGGSPGTGVYGSGSGGHGGNPTGNGDEGISPGGGAGGGSTNADGAIGGHGQVRLSYLTGTPTIMWSVSSASGTDPFGNAYQSGAWQSLGLTNGWAGTCFYRMWDGMVQLSIVLDSSAATAFQFGTLPTGFRPSSTMYIGAGASGNVAGLTGPMVQVATSGAVSMIGVHTFSTAGTWGCNGSYPLSV